MSLRIDRKEKTTGGEGDGREGLFGARHLDFTGCGSFSGLPLGGPGVTRGSFGLGLGWAELCFTVRRSSAPCPGIGPSLATRRSSLVGTRARRR